MTTLNLQVSASSDDAYQDSGGNVDITDTADTASTATDFFGFRFLNLTIPPGSTIDTCTAQVNVATTANDDPDDDLDFEDVDSAATFVAAASNISNRTPTGNAVTWTDTAVGTGFVVTPSIVTPLQAVIDRGGWASGNDVALLFDHRSTNGLRVRMFDDSGAVAPKLDIDFTEPVGGERGTGRGIMRGVGRGI